MGEKMETEMEALKSFSPLFEADVAEVFNFSTAVARRAALGGTSPASVHAQIAQARQRL
jgi:argininosuccinate lyase